MLPLDPAFHKNSSIFIFEIYFTVIALPDFDVHMELCSLDTLLFGVATNLLTLTLVAVVAPGSEVFV